MSQMYPEIQPTAPEMDTFKGYPPPPAYTAADIPQQQQQPPYPYQPAVGQPQPQQPPPPTQTTTIVNTVIAPDLPSKACNIKCFYCQEDIRTKVKPKASVISYLFCTLLCIFGCFCGCCLIPFCTNGTRDILHYCPKCNKYLGVYERMRFRRR